VELLFDTEDGYLEKGCTLTDDYEMVAVAEDVDTPVEALELPLDCRASPARALLASGARGLLFFFAVA